MLDSRLIFIPQSVLQDRANGRRNDTLDTAEATHGMDAPPFGIRSFEWRRRLGRGPPVHAVTFLFFGPFRGSCRPAETAAVEKR